MDSRKRSHGEIDLPPGWRAAQSQDDRTYFYNVETRETRWTFPTAATDEQIHEAASRCAYVWLLMNSYSYAAGAIVSAWSLRRQETSATLVCMVTEDVPAWIRPMLGAVFDRVVQVPRIEQACIALNTPRKQQLYGLWFNHAFTKWNALGLEEYEKVLFVDADTVVVRPMDDIFLLPAPAGTFSSPWHAPWNRDARRPNPFADLRHGDAVPDRLVEAALADHGSVVIGNCVLLPTGRHMASSFRTWLQQAFPRAFGYSTCSSMFDEQAITAFMLHGRRQWTYLDQAYNAIPWKLDTGWLRGRSPCLLHYFGENKPWNVGINGKGYHADMSVWAEVAVDLLKAEPQMAVFVTVPRAPPSEAPEAEPPSTSASGARAFVVDEAQGDECVVAGAYDATAAFKRNEARDDSATIGLRRSNNFLKVGLNVAAVSLLRKRAKGQRVALRIFDAACGTGGDVGKFLKSAKDAGMPIEAYLAADVSTESVAACKSRLADAGFGELSAAVAIDLSRRDIGEVLADLPQAKINSFNIASCQFAMHYFFRSEAALRQLARSIGRLLDEGGIFVAIFADVAMQMHDALRDDPLVSHVCVGPVRMTPHPDLRQAMTSRACMKAVSFGMGYDVSLGQHVQGATEYLTNVDVLARVMREEAHLHLVLDVGAADMADAMVNHRAFWAKTAADMGVDRDGRWNDVMALYRAAVFIRDTGDGEVHDEVHRSRKFMHSILGIDDAHLVDAKGTAR